MQKLLIVDDEIKIREVLKEYAEFEGFLVDMAQDGMDAVKKCQENKFDLILMDVMMPKLDGFSASKKIRESQNIPIIILSARGEEYDKLFGFEIGIDDYVVKPFSPKEVMARVKAVLKRYEKLTENKELTFEGLKIDDAGRNVFINGEKIKLNPKEYDLLVFLAKNNNIAVSRDKILNIVWGYEFFGADRTIDTHIKMLRNNLKEYGKYIVTIRGVGYKFEA